MKRQLRLLAPGALLPLGALRADPELRGAGAKNARPALPRGASGGQGEGSMAGQPQSLEASILDAVKAGPSVERDVVSGTPAGASGAHPAPRAWRPRSLSASSRAAFLLPQGQPRPHRNAAPAPVASSPSACAAMVPASRPRGRPTGPARAGQACASAAGAALDAGAVQRGIQPVRVRRRGQALDLERTLTGGEKSELLAAYHRDKFAAKSVPVRESYLRTWCRYLCVWFGEQVSPVPVEISHLAAIGALMKGQDYRSFAAYASRMRDLHIRAGFYWSQQHVHEVQQGARSVTRGQGPPRQSAPLYVPDVAKIQDEQADGAVGPVDLRRVFIVGCGFMLREAEVAFARRSHVSFDDTQVVATLELPTSKTDATAIGCSRSWGCICEGGAAECCVFHALQEHVRHIDGLFGTDLAGFAGRPLFPNSAGETCSKDSVVKAVEHLALELKQDLVDELGYRRFGGHSLRVSGAQWLARVGVPVPLIRSLARWESDTVMRYIREAHLHGLAGAVVQCLKRRQVVSGADYAETRDDFTPADLQADTSLRDDLALVQAEVQRAIEVILETKERVGQQEEVIANHLRGTAVLQELPEVALTDMVDHYPPYVMNTDSRRVHRLGYDGLAGEACGWSALCGWVYGRVRGYRLIYAEHDSEAISVCDRCCRRDPRLRDFGLSRQAA